MLNPPVVADRGLRPNDMKPTNLFLFGTKSTNSVIAQLSDRLPMQLNDSATGYGLLFVYPIDGHDVVVSSGTQWWTPPPANVPVFGPGGRGGGGRGGVAGAGAGAQRDRPVFTTFTPFGGRPANALYGLGDWVLYRGSLQNIVFQGRFDENWKIPTADAEKLKASGVVTLAATK